MKNQQNEPYSEILALAQALTDRVLDVSCCSKGKRLFNRLCKSFGQIYPDCVKAYIGFDREMWGDEDKG